MLLNFILLPFPPIKFFHLTSFCCCSSPVSQPFSFFHFVYTWLCLDNFSLPQKPWDGQQCILPSLSSIFSLHCSYFFLSCLFHSLGKQYLCMYMYVYVYMYICMCMYVYVYVCITQRPAPGNHIPSQCCD